MNIPPASQSRWSNSCYTTYTWKIFSTVSNLCLKSDDFHSKPRPPSLKTYSFIFVKVDKRIKRLREETRRYFKYRGGDIVGNIWTTMLVHINFFVCMVKKCYVSEYPNCITLQALIFVHNYSCIQLKRICSSFSQTIMIYAMQFKPWLQDLFY